MDIRWYGHTACELKQKSFTILIDPFGKDVGLGKPTWKPDIVTLCRKDYEDNVLPSLGNKPRIIAQAGEYEINDIFIYGIRTVTKENKENIMFKFEYENHHMLHLSHLGEKLNDQQMEQIGIVDVLLLTLGSSKTLDMKDSKDLIEEIDPRVIIPIDTTLKDANPLDSPLVQEFLKIMGKSPAPAQETFPVDKYNYNPEGTDVFLLQKTAI